MLRFTRLLLLKSRSFENATICHMAEKTYSTLDAAKKAGVHRATLIRWIQAGHVDATHKMTMPGGRILRSWTKADIEKIEQYKEDHYWDMPKTKNE